MYQNRHRFRPEDRLLAAGSLTAPGGSPKIGEPIHSESVSLVDFKEKGPNMAIQRVLALALAAVTAVGVTPSLAQQATGIISGIADDEAKKPYSDYSVQLRDAATGQVVNTVALDAAAKFSFDNVGLTRQLLVELVSLKSKQTVCTEGPFTLTPTATSKTNVKIACGKRVPTAVWLLAAGAGAAAAIGLTDDGGGAGPSGGTPTVTSTGVQSASQ